MSRPRFEQLSRDVARVAMGDDRERAMKRLAVNGGQVALKALGLPGPMVDAAAGLIKQVFKSQLYSNGLITPNLFYDEDGEKRFHEWILGIDSGLVTILGAQGTGKTSLGAQLAYNWMPSLWTPEEREHYADKLPIPVAGAPDPTLYWVNYPNSALHNVPGKRMRWHISSLMEVEDDDHWGESKLNPGDIILMPDAYTYINSKSFGFDEMGNVAELLPAVLRHLKVRGAVDFHDTSQIGKGILQSRCSIYKTMPSNYQALERDVMLRRAHTAMDALTQCGNCGHGVRLHDGMKKCRGFCNCVAYSPVIPAEQRNFWAYVYAEECDYQGLIKTTRRPPWYSMKLSEAHAEQGLSEIFPQALRRRKKKPQEDTDVITDGEFVDL